MITEKELTDFIDYRLYKWDKKRLGADYLNNWCEAYRDVRLKFSKSTAKAIIDKIKEKVKKSA